MRASGVLLAMFLTMSLLAVNHVDATTESKSKHSIKKDIKEIRKLIDDKTVKITKISKSRTLHIWHIVEIQVCAGMENLYSPDLELHSDRDSIQVTIWGLIVPKSCKTTEFFIAADDPDSISVNFSRQNYREPTK
ncbi:MAG: hypothetical protein ACT4OD_01735 [Candidatus Nitrosotenuis sp.]